MKKYVVKPGDTLYQISKKTGVRIPLLLASNPQIQNPGQLMPGMTMVIPELGKPAKAGTTAAPGTGMQGDKQSTTPYFGFVWPHKVQPGESWHSISQKYGVSFEQLKHVNPEMSPNMQLHLGTVMYIPSSAFQIPAQNPMSGGTQGSMETGMPGGMQGGMPGMMPGGMQQGGMPGMMPGGMQQAGMPGMMPGGMQQAGMPGMMPGGMEQGGMPGMMPGGMQQAGMPGMMPGGMEQGGMPGMMPGGMQGGMPGTMPGGMQGTEPQGAPITEDTYGPHTHHPYRAEYQQYYMPQAPMEVPVGWYVDIEDSSSFLSSWGGWDNAIGDNGPVRSTSEDASETDDDQGWSGAMTVRLDKEE
ncbi:LysM peptidoglycan-binding domain-containing protein [Alicyclobacillus dauci]|uniref:LysM peptidoglycan-binding domain-containing protein n=1 Tax=Alicyclobacillus dauci TaxID=1475485 RepID=A0ABY6Z6B9_9BACL|nr:LysM domain-containing protein [Alicyclobacillus dauci]WAH38415.1 LysM peptidoglycan-binding domain-containing protein [Alicyclobacillus dauci]